MWSLSQFLIFFFFFSWEHNLVYEEQPYKVSIIDIYWWWVWRNTHFSGSKKIREKFLYTFVEKYWNLWKILAFCQWPPFYYASFISSFLIVFVPGSSKRPDPWPEKCPSLENSAKHPYSVILDLRLLKKISDLDRACKLYLSCNCFVEYDYQSKKYFSLTKNWVFLKKNWTIL